MPHQNDVAQIPLLDEIRHAFYIVIMGNACPVGPRPMPGIRRRVHGMTEFAQAPRGRLPGPAAVPRAMQEHKRLTHRAPRATRTAGPDAPGRAPPDPSWRPPSSPGNLTHAA